MRRRALSRKLRFLRTANGCRAYGAANCSFNRVGGNFFPLPHHRTCRSAYGGSVLLLVCLNAFALLLYDFLRFASYTFRLLLISSIRITSSNDKLNRSALPDFSVLWLRLISHDSLLLRISPLVRSHGISLRSFLVYLPNLRIRVTAAFWTS